MKKYVEYAVSQIMELCKVPSPSGFTKKITGYLSTEFTKLGYMPRFSNKGSILVDLGGEGEGLVLAAHVDALGAMVRSINDQGRLVLTKLGAYPENFIETENCTIHTRTGKEYTGRILIKNPSVHLGMEVADTKRTLANMEVVIDEKVFTKEEVKKLEINAGDFVSFDPRTIYTASGFIKSRHLDDKAGTGVLMALAKYVREHKIKLPRKVYLLFTTYEEVGHGGSCGFPADVGEMISVDMGTVGDDLETDEFKVSICAKNSKGPLDYDVTNRLIHLARKHALNYAVDIYPAYAADVDVALAAGHDIKHGLIGPGIAASHGYERTHTDSLENTLVLLKEYIIDFPAGT